MITGAEKDGAWRTQEEILKCKYTVVQTPHVTMRLVRSRSSESCDVWKMCVRFLHGFDWLGMDSKCVIMWDGDKIPGSLITSLFNCFNCNQTRLTYIL